MSTKRQRRAKVIAASPLKSKKKKDAWGAMQMHTDSIAHALHTPILIRPLLQDPRIDKKFVGEERERILEDINILSLDTKHFAERTKALSDRHIGRTGEPTDDDDRLNLIHIDQEYKAIHTDITTVLLPNLLSISAKLERRRDEVIKDQEEILAKLKQEQDAQAIKSE